MISSPSFLGSARLCSPLLLLLLLLPLVVCVHCPLRLQGVIFCTDNTAVEIVAKVSYHMFVYNPLWATPSCLLAYYWNDSNFDWRAVYSKFISRKYRGS